MNFLKANLAITVVEGVFLNVEGLNRVFWLAKYEDVS